MDWPAALTIASTILAAVLAVWGHFWAARRQARRISRLRLYEELLPRIEGYMSVGFGRLGKGEDETAEWDRLMIDVLNELKRTASLAGSKDEKLADELIGELYPRPDPKKFPDWPPESLDRNDPAFLALRRFYAYLKERIR
jgi:hypothetical protein